MTDRLTLEPALLPELNRTLARAASTAGSQSGSVSRLVGWASTRHPSLAPAAASLREAQRALTDTSTRLTDMRRDVGLRANLLGLEASPSIPPGSGSKQDWFFGRTPEQANAQHDTQQDDIITDLWQMPWFAYGGIRDSALQWGYGMLHVPLGDPGGTEVQSGSSIDMFTQQAKVGLVDPENSRWGIAGDAQAMGLDWKMGHNRFGVTEVDGDALSANAEASVGKDGLTVGAQANVAEGSFTGGGPLSSKRADDGQGRFGLGAGVGLAGRVHWSDEDKDGVREVGFGLDVGPISLDAKSENLDVVAAARRLLG